MEFSTLNGYKVKDKKAVRFYDTVADMKSDTTLKSGMHVKTKGYYEANDGGHGEYIIKSTSTGLYETLNNELVGELVINGEININSLGADSTGINDSSLIFNSAFQYINSLWLSGNYKINTVVTNGKYLWTNQVKMPPCARLRNSGYTTILTNVSGSALLIDYLTTDNPSNFPGNKQDWLFAELINFSNGGIFKNVGENLTNTCIEIGRNSDIGELLPYSRYKLCNFRIYNYEIGILHNKYHNYMGKFDNISFEVNTIGVQYGIESGAVTDSGENMTYNNCLFSTGTDAIKWYVDGFDSSFVNCSFDYVTNCFNDYGNHGYKRISVVNSHIEGITKICNKLGAYSELSILDSSIILKYKGDLFSDIDDKDTINLHNNKIVSQSTTIYDPSKIIDVTKGISLINNTSQDKNTKMFLNSSLIPSFDHLEDGTIADFNVNSKIGVFKVIDMTGSTFSAKIVTDNYLYTGHKSFVLVGTTNSSGNKVIILQSDFISINNINRILKTNFFTHNCRGSEQISYAFYDNEKNLISETSGYIYIPENTNKTVGEWYMTPYGKYEQIPNGTSYVKIKIILSSINNSTADEIGTEYKIGGIIVN